MKKDEPARPKRAKNTNKTETGNTAKTQKQQETESQPESPLPSDLNKAKSEMVHAETEPHSTRESAGRHHSVSWSREGKYMAVMSVKSFALSYPF